MTDKILSLYARSLTAREIKSRHEKMYGTEVSPTLSSSGINAVIGEVKARRPRPTPSPFSTVFTQKYVSPRPP